MGIEDLNLTSTQFPGTLAFDTTYSYNINTSFPYSISDVSFYKNPATGDFPAYVQKTDATPVTWNGENYQQFWTINYQGALWATNGMEVPFTVTNIGMQFAIPSVSTRINATTMDFTIVGNPLVIGDYVFVNELVGSAGGDETKINFQTGYVITAGNTFRVRFPDAAITAGTYTGGMVQYLTNRSDATKDCIRWYDGDPTDGNATSPTLTPGKGWVNFCPPLSQAAFSIADLPEAQYYLAGAKMILNFKDRLLFFGPVIQTSAGNDQTYLPDTVIYSQNGTPYYTCSFTGDPVSSDTVFTPILVPTNQTATAAAFYEDQTGFGGFTSAGVNQPIITVSPNEDALIIGFSDIQTRFIYSGNDIVPFNFFLINSEYGSASTFSIVNMDHGVITRGSKGFIETGQTQARRIDLEIPDQVFEINGTNNGNERFCAQRDFINEWVSFTYPSNIFKNVFPNLTLQYNYRDDSWATFYECYTTYGTFRKQTGFIWSTVGFVYPTWQEWNDPWNAGESTLLQPQVVGGNQQGFILVKNVGTGEGNSLYIQDITGSTITSPDHCLNTGDYIIISDALGTISTEVNDKIFSIANVTTDTFTLNPNIASGTYLGSGVIKRMYVPFIQTKQFPMAWGMGRKTRIGPQQYLFTNTDDAQIQLLIYLSQDGSNPYNDSLIVPNTGSINNSLIYSTILYTCPESTNLGLTAANTNLQMPTAVAQSQIWHRVNTSLIGDTVQFAFTLSDDQMREIDDDGFPTNQFAEIELHGFIVDVSPSQLLA